jgi:hypothetical protein
MIGTVFDDNQRGFNINIGDSSVQFCVDAKETFFVVQIV